MLAVTTNDSGIKILANAEGMRMIRMLDSRSFEGARVPTDLMGSKVFHTHMI